MRNQGALQTTEFYDYRAPIESTSITHVIRQATSHALTHPGSDLVSSHELQFWSGEVQLILYPGKLLTWRMWRASIISMNFFVKKRGMAYEWSFMILEDGKPMMMNEF